MSFGTLTIKSIIVGAVVGLVPFVLPATASAYGYYHYVAGDTYYDNVWPSKEPIKRLYWHHTPGGFGASIKCDIDGKITDWIWIPLSDDGWGGFSGSTTKNGYDVEVLVVRFNGQSGAYVPESVKDPYAWSANAYVCIVVRQEGMFVGFAEGILYANPGDHNWW